MSALPIDFQHFFPWVSFIAGLGGSLHCLGMCGGLVTASCDKSPDIFRYQLGRLLGYLALGFCAGSVGDTLGKSLNISLSHFIIYEKLSPWAGVLPGVAMGSLFLFWGVQNFRGKKAEVPMPKFMGKFYSFLWRKLIYKNASLSKAFFTGLISIFLPCGLLYGMALGTVALGHPLIAGLSMFFFWLGTLPSMVFAPSAFQRILTPMKINLPKTYATSLILIGLLTISFRIIKIYEINANKTNPESKSPTAEMTCH